MRFNSYLKTIDTAYGFHDFISERYQIYLEELVSVNDEIISLANSVAWNGEALHDELEYREYLSAILDELSYILDVLDGYCSEDE